MVLVNNERCSVNSYLYANVKNDLWNRREEINLVTLKTIATLQEALFVKKSATTRTNTLQKINN